MLIGKLDGIHSVGYEKVGLQSEYNRGALQMTSIDKEINYHFDVLTQTIHRGFRTHYNVERNRTRLYPCLYPSLRMGRVKSAAEARIGASAIDDGSSEIVFGVQSMGCDFGFTTVDVEGISRISTYEGHANPERRWVPELTHAFTIEIAPAEFVIDNVYSRTQSHSGSIILQGRFMNILSSETKSKLGLDFNMLRIVVFKVSQHEMPVNMGGYPLPKHFTVGETLDIAFSVTYVVLSFCRLFYDQDCSLLYFTKFEVVWFFNQVLGYLKAEVVQKSGLPALG
ncbi:hypothetical protein F5876DRAFT_64674 [Lentinula aff. lateritia]|uniref:Uncharacterized protein n=1 Tax=Lentinula aff. lateritia TaxID=2804960 RepID=A0ACC1U3H2_9AGAR|nr:hypothetical protein F5876DRAFT_64674 [Lentinula aff. lateritia]